MQNNILPEELIAMVASKGGTTVAGLKMLDKLKAKDILSKTVNAAAKRSREMGK
jgi:pyrroline-5-carboxylate reductase